MPHDVATVMNGDEIRAALLWQGTGALPDLELADEAGAWRVTVPSHLCQHGDITLDWRSIRVPPDAPGGTAALRLGGVGDAGALPRRSAAAADRAAAV